MNYQYLLLANKTFANKFNELKYLLLLLIDISDLMRQLNSNVANCYVKKLHLTYDWVEYIRYALDVMITADVRFKYEELLMHKLAADAGDDQEKQYVRYLIYVAMKTIYSSNNSMIVTALMSCIPCKYEENLNLSITLHRHKSPFYGPNKLSKPELIKMITGDDAYIFMSDMK